MRNIGHEREAVDAVIQRHKEEPYTRLPASAKLRFQQKIGKRAANAVTYLVMDRLYECVYFRGGGGRITPKLLAADVGIALRNVYRHVKLLQESGVVNLKMKRGLITVCYPDPEYIAPAREKGKINHETPSTSTVSTIYPLDGRKLNVWLLPEATFTVPVGLIVPLDPDEAVMAYVVTGASLNVTDIVCIAVTLVNV